MRKPLKKEFIMEDGRVVCYSNLRFMKAINEAYARYKESGQQDYGTTKQDYLEYIADETSISASAINHWLLGHNAPSDFDKISCIARAVNIPVEMFFESSEKIVEHLSEEKKIMEEKVIERVIKVETPQQVAKEYADHNICVRNIYYEIVDFIEMFLETASFRYDEWGMPDEKLLFMGLDMLHEIRKKIRKSMLDIPYSVYQELLLFENGYLEEMMEIDIWDSSYFYPCYVSNYESSTNPYRKRFIDFKAYEKENSKYYDYKEEYLKEVAELAYEMMDEILKDYIIK